MRQRSASDPESYPDKHFEAPASYKSTAHLSSKTPHTAPRLSLPQRSVIADSSIANLPTDNPPRARKRLRSKEPPKQALTIHSQQTNPLDFQKSPSLADIHLIPRTEPAVKAMGWHSWFHKSSPRVTIIKLSLITIVLFSILGATLATAGDTEVRNFLFSTLQSIMPYTPHTQPSSFITQRVHPIIQADLNAGYDSPQQHDIWWDSACSAAALTELLHAWGVADVTIGEVIDEMSAHNPPYITPWGGLMSQNGWGYIAGIYHLHATVQLNRALSYGDIVRTTQAQGIPVVLGLRDNSGRYFPAFAGGGHFLIAVGGDASGLRIVDSSLYRITFLPYDELNYLWTGETVIIKS
jgi:hypothetical protein